MRQGGAVGILHIGDASSVYTSVDCRKVLILHENRRNGQLKVFWPIDVAAAHMPQVQIRGTTFEEGRIMGIDLTKKCKGKVCEW